MYFVVNTIYKDVTGNYVLKICTHSQMAKVAWRKLKYDAKNIIPDMYSINDNMYYQTIPLKGVGNDKTLRITQP